MTRQNMKIGFIGIGMMGTPMAANLVKAGFDVTVYHPKQRRGEAFAAAFGGASTDALGTLADSDTVVTMLPTGQVVREVLLGSPGVGLAAALKPGAIVVDMSSSEPTGTRELGQVLAQRNIRLIDAPVSGGVQRAQGAKLTIMYGCDDDGVFTAVEGVLRAVGDRLFRTGGLGSGHAMKALNNCVAAAAFAATSEALALGEKFGLDGGTMVDILNVSTGRNFFTELVMKEQVLGGKFASGFSVGLLAKDVKIAADLSEALHHETPVLRLVSQRWAQARDILGPHEDHTKGHVAWKQGAVVHPSS
jgi:3-hydroxyisobutyrate dehydrogenase